MNDQQQEQTDVGVEPGSVPAIGDLLRSARESRGESLSDVAHALKLSSRQVEALELERFDILPGPAFVRGFMRNYARHIGIDVEARIARLTFGETPQGVHLAPVTNATGDMPSGRGARNALKPAMVVIAGMLVILAAGWYFDWFKVVEGEAVNAVSVSEPASSAGVTTSGFATAPQAPMTMPRLASGAEPVSPVDGETTPLQEALGSDGASTDAAAIEGSEGVAPGMTVAEGEEAVAEGEEAVTEGPATAMIEETSIESGRLVFSLSGESWIQVRDGEGAALYTGTGSAGTTRTVQGKPPFSIVVGNAGLVSLEYDGEAVDLAPHIRSGGVARMILR